MYIFEAIKNIKIRLNSSKVTIKKVKQGYKTFNRELYDYKLLYIFEKIIIYLMSQYNYNFVIVYLKNETNDELMIRSNY